MSTTLQYEIERLSAALEQIHGRSDRHSCHMRAVFLREIAFLRRREAEAIEAAQREAEGLDSE